MGRNDFTSLIDVKVDDILLDEGNPRIRAGRNQEDCIERMLSESRKREQMYKLMKSIAEEGLSTAQILVTSSKEQKGKVIVKDGNRRIAALKLLNKSSLCKDVELRSKIQSIVEANKQNIPDKVDCLYSDNDRAIANEVLQLHSGALGGIGQLDWSAYLRTIYLLNNDFSAEYKRAGQYLLWAEEHNITVNDDFPISTVSRFFSAENVKILGLDISGDKLVLIDLEIDVINMAKCVINDFATGRKKVDHVFTSERAQEYLSQIRVAVGLPITPATIQTNSVIPKPSSVSSSTALSSPPSSAAPSSAVSIPSSQSKSPQNQSPESSSVTTADDGKAATSSKKRGRAPSKPSWDRKALFWKASPIPSVPSSQTKVRAVLFEISKICDVRETPLTTAFLIRALIELSEKYYRIKHNLQDKNKLSDNIFAACDSMHGKSLITKSESEIIKAYTVTTKSDIGIFNVDTLQKYIHRETHLPSPQTINTFWDELHPFVRACWS
jgi:hypothetical protein